LDHTIVDEYYLLGLPTYKNKKQVLDLFVRYPTKIFEIIEQLSVKLKADKEIALASVVLEEAALSVLSEDMRSDRDVVITAMKAFPDTI